jgi:hypothetical protein
MTAMTADTTMLGSLLTLAGLIAGTAEYSHVIRRRAVARARFVADEAMRTDGLRGLVRVFAVDERT